MYIPKSYAVEDAATLYAFIKRYNFGTMVTQHQGSMKATLIPFMLDDERGVLKAHMARANDQWKDFDGSEALILFQGPHAYVSPSWYEERLSVPTWNYTAAHVYGVPSIIEDESTVRQMLQELVRNHEHGRDPEWQMALPEDYLHKMMQAIVAFEIKIERIEGKFKLSQNRSQADQVSVMAHLAARESELEHDTARMMQELKIKVK